VHQGETITSPSLLTFISSNYVEAVECHSHSSNDKSNAVAVADVVAVASVVAIPVRVIVTVVPIARSRKLFKSLATHNCQLL